MITKFKVGDLKKALGEEDYLYEYTTHISDKLRAIYVLFGWVHMLESFDQTQNTIDQLLNHVYHGLIKEKEARVETAGLMIDGWVDEDGFVNLDYYFNLG